MAQLLKKCNGVGCIFFKNQLAKPNIIYWVIIDQVPYSLFEKGLVLF